MNRCVLLLALFATLGANAAPASDREPLQVSVWREGFVPYMPHASYRINVKVPQAKLQEGWRCCWIEAFSRPVATLLTSQEQRTVAGNDVDVQLDSERTEYSLRELAPGIFEGSLYLSSTQGWGSRAARIYVHLYQNAEGVDSPYDPRTERYRGLGRQGNRVASDFLLDPFITVRFMYPPRPTQLPIRPGDTVPGAPPSQLPNN
ncbi:MAG: hypothetical protein H7Y28_06440 [Rhodoferax sp.]|nr:hypothetical protein [Rhodoferax sp.]